jgi:hypothetical protein
MKIDRIAWLAAGSGGQHHRPKLFEGATQTVARRCGPPWARSPTGRVASLTGNRMSGRARIDFRPQLNPVGGENELRVDQVPAPQACLLLRAEVMRAIGGAEGSSRRVERAAGAPPGWRPLESAGRKCLSALWAAAGCLRRRAGSASRSESVQRDRVGGPVRRQQLNLE